MMNNNTKSIWYGIYFLSFNGQEMENKLQQEIIENYLSFKQINPELHQDIQWDKMDRSLTSVISNLCNHEFNLFVFFLVVFVIFFFISQDLCKRIKEFSISNLDILPKDDSNEKNEIPWQNRIAVFISLFLTSLFLCLHEYYSGVMRKEAFLHNEKELWKFILNKKETVISNDDFFMNFSVFVSQRGELPKCSKSFFFLVTYLFITFFLKDIPKWIRYYRLKRKITEICKDHTLYNYWGSYSNENNSSSLQALNKHLDERQKLLTGEIIKVINECYTANNYKELREEFLLLMDIIRDILLKDIDRYLNTYLENKKREVACSIESIEQDKNIEQNIEQDKKLLKIFFIMSKDIGKNRYIKETDIEFLQMIVSQLDVEDNIEQYIQLRDQKFFWQEYYKFTRNFNKKMSYYGVTGGNCPGVISYYEITSNNDSSVLDLQTLTKKGFLYDLIVEIMKKPLSKSIILNYNKNFRIFNTRNYSLNNFFKHPKDTTKRFFQGFSWEHFIGISVFLALVIAGYVYEIMSYSQEEQDDKLLTQKILHRNINGVVASFSYVVQNDLLYYYYNRVLFLLKKIDNMKTERIRVRLYGNIISLTRVLLILFPWAREVTYILICMEQVIMAMNFSRVTLIKIFRKWKAFKNPLSRTEIVLQSVGSLIVTSIVILGMIYDGYYYGISAESVIRSLFLRVLCNSYLFPARIFACSLMKDKKKGNSLRIVDFIFGLLPQISFDNLNYHDNGETLIKNGDINIQNLWFAYPKAQEFNPEEEDEDQDNGEEPRYVLKGLNLKIKEKECLLLLGENGQGKSTLVDLIRGKFDDYTGNISIGPLDRKNISHSSLRKNILFVGSKDRPVGNKTITIREAILSMIPCPTGFISDEEIFDVIKQAGLEKRITDLNELYENTAFSTGQNQKFVNMVAYLLPYSSTVPKIVILDESFSGVNYKYDSSDKSQVQDDRCTLINNIIEQYKKFGITVIMVSHEQLDSFLSSVPSIDKIVLLDKGQVLWVKDNIHKNSLQENKIETIGNIITPVLTDDDTYGSNKETIDGRL